MEVMGLHLPGAAFVHPGTQLREALTRQAATRALAITARSAEYTPISKVVDERAIVNGIVALMATGGSTNHTIHLVAIAAAAGIQVNWDDFDEISRATPLLAADLSERPLRHQPIPRRRRHGVPDRPIDQGRFAA